MKNVITRLTVPAIVLFMVVYACGQDVHYNYARSANFMAYKTYRWIEMPARSVPDPLIHDAIKRAVDEQLAQKGLTRVEDNADLLVGYQAVVDLEKSVSLTGSNGPGGWGGFGMDSVHGRVSTVMVGILVLDVYDAGKKDLIWRGDVSKTLDLKKDPDKNYKNLQKAMAKLFRNYPPQESK